MPKETLSRWPRSCSEPRTHSPVAGRDRKKIMSKEITYIRQKRTHIYAETDLIALTQKLFVATNPLSRRRVLDFEKVSFRGALEQELRQFRGKCHTHELCMSHVTYEWVRLTLKTSRFEEQWRFRGKPYTRTVRVSHVTHEWVMSHQKRVVSNFNTSHS